MAQLLMLSAMVGNREGSFLLAPHAKLDDGRFDVVGVSNMSRGHVLGMLPRLALFGLPAHHPQIAVWRCRTLHVQSSLPLAVHTDGEMFCTVDDRILELAIQILPSWLSVKVCEP
jgi:diacylglycerol kinase family enzyme